MAYTGQRKYGGGKFKSLKQRKFLWAVYPKAAEKWAHLRKTTKRDWSKTGRAIKSKKIK